jgi:hypothetical protein
MKGNEMEKQLFQERENNFYQRLGRGPKVIKDYIQPDFSHYFWKNDLDPTYLEKAKKFWSS